LRESAESVAAHLDVGGGGVVAEADGQIVGCGLWSVRDGGLYFGRMSVAAQWRKAGVARQMVAIAEAAARAQGLPKLWVGVRLALASNRRLFTSLGYHDTTLHAHDGFSAPTWVDMEKRLD
jgi:GNAT superfamily N-acetyltransferase